MTHVYIDRKELTDSDNMTALRTERNLSILLCFLSITCTVAFHLPPQNRRFLHRQLSELGESKSKTASVEDEDTQNNGPINSKSLLEDADNSLRLQKFVDERQDSEDDGAAMNRRLFLGAGLLGTSAAISNLPDNFVTALADEDFDRDGFGKLSWSTTPINKRTGVTLFDAEKFGYNVRFVTYLSRFLLVFDVDCQKWWYSKAADIPRVASKEEVEQVRLKQFGAFSASVEVGLQEYGGSGGPAKLMKALISRYCPDLSTIRKTREQQGLSKLTEDQGRTTVHAVKNLFLFLRIYFS